jgi:ethanolamine transporter EutH
MIKTITVSWVTAAGLYIAFAPNNDDRFLMGMLCGALLFGITDFVHNKEVANKDKKKKNDGYEYD